MYEVSDKALNVETTVRRFHHFEETSNGFILAAKTCAGARILHWRQGKILTSSSWSWRRLLVGGQNNMMPCDHEDWSLLDLNTTG